MPAPSSADKTNRSGASPRYTGRRTRVTQGIQMWATVFAMAHVLDETHSRDMRTITALTISSQIVDKARRWKSGKNLAVTCSRVLNRQFPAESPATAAQWRCWAVIPHDNCRYLGATHGLLRNHPCACEISADSTSTINAPRRDRQP